MSTSETTDNGTLKVQFREAVRGVDPVHYVEEKKEAIEEDLIERKGEPAEPLFGVLPLARFIPQNIHSLMDYGNGAAVAATFAACDTMTGKIASLAFGGSVIGVSAMTDYKLSAAKLIPIEAHEAIDHLWGASLIAAPFVLGYWKKDKVAAITHIAIGASTILASLFTDYRRTPRRRES